MTACSGGRPSHGYARLWLRAVQVLLAVGVAAGLFLARPFVVAAALVLDTAVIALVYGALAWILPALRPSVPHPVQHVLQRSALVVAVLVSFWVAATRSVLTALVIAALVAASSPVSLRWFGRHRPGGAVAADCAQPHRRTPRW